MNHRGKPASLNGSPLPPGEGQGEGMRGKAGNTRNQASLRFALTRPLSRERERGPCIGIACLAGMILLAAAAVFAQEEKPKAAKKPKPAAAHPAAAAAKAPAGTAAPTGEPAEVQVPQPDDPAVQAILESNPTTAAEYSRGAKILADLQRPDLAKTFLQKALDTKPSEQQLADLAKQFGVTMFLDLASQPELCPPARQLADAVVAANAKQLTDPQHLADLTKKIQDSSDDVRAQALAGLKDAHAAGVEALVAVLADRRHEAEHPTARLALINMGSEAAGPMLAILDGDNVEMKVEAIKVLSDLRGTEAALFLLAPYCAAGSDPRVRAAADAALTRLLGHVPTPAEAAQLLLKQATAYWQQRQPIRGESDGRAPVWQWDAENNRCLAASVAVADAARLYAARLARDAAAILPNNRQARLLHLATALDETAYRHGLARAAQLEKDPAVVEAARCGVSVINDLLAYAASGHHVGAEIVAASLMGRLGKAQEVLRNGAEPAPLAQALRDPDRRVRMAAAQAIVRLQPLAPFAGASHLVETLCFLAGSSGTRRALVAGPNIDTLRETAEMLSAAGYQTDTAATGREAIRMASALPDYEVAFLDTTIDDPPAELLLPQLRHDCRTATLRVGVLARAGRLEQAERIAGEDPMAMAFSRPHTPEALRWQLAQLATLAPREFVGLEERQSQAAAALECLAQLATTSGRLYDISRAQSCALAALYVPNLGARAAAVLAHVGTPDAQRGLVDLASRPSQPLDARRAAASAFRLNAQERGVLLSGAEIARQYERYNQSARQEFATQRVLSAVLDCIEAAAPAGVVPRKPVPPAKPATPPKAEKKDSKKASP